MCKRFMRIGVTVERVAQSHRQLYDVNDRYAVIARVLLTLST